MARSVSTNFYKSTAWIKCRNAYMEYRHFTCERCGHRAEIVHHKKHLNDTNVNDPMIALGWDNLQALCIPCHNAVHGCGSGVPDGFKFDADGNLIKRSR